MLSAVILLEELIKSVKNGDVLNWETKIDLSQSQKTDLKIRHFHSVPDVLF